jgi:hypothetical protein
MSKSETINVFLRKNILIQILIFFFLTSNPQTLTIEKHTSKMLRVESLNISTLQNDLGLCPQI